MACAVSLVTSWATRRPQRWPGGVNLHISPRKLPFHWLSAAAGVSDMHRFTSAWFPDMNEVQNGLCGVSGHFLGHSTATTMAWGVNLHILPKKLPFHWLSAAAGVSDMHRPASAWFPDMNEVQNGLCGASGHFLGHWTATSV